MTDQDHDGFHIKGLLMNLFQCMWPSLLDIGFICSMVTPIVKAKRGFGKRMEVKQFYTLTDYENWWNSLGNNTKGWTIKYYKGLGTSDKKEAKEYFTDLRVISYVH